MRRVPTTALAGLTVALFGCNAGTLLSKRAEGLQAKVALIEGPAKRCAPRELAVAQTQLEFVQLELDQGAYSRAQAHLDEANEAWRVAEVAARAPGCQASADRDGDGLLPPQDLCPEAAEDFDGEADGDGCPEQGDRDQDGIVDAVDACPDVPEDKDGEADTDGCPEADDRDGDGIADATDTCPDTPEDKDAFEDTDGCPEPDNDQDTLLDGVDKCPLQAEDKDGFEDTDGCPDPDNDQDRIADAADQCPNQAEDYDGEADTDGCPDLYKSIIVRDDRIELKQTVYFATGKDRILPKSFDLLNEVALALRDNPSFRVRIEGHTDSQGAANANQRLSQRRAESVRRYLIDQAIAADRLEAIGLGEETPIEDNRTAAGRAANRRVEFHLVKK